MNSLNSMSKASSGGRCGIAIKFLAAAFGILLLCLPAFSQGNAGRILGTVTDQSGGVVAGATVSVIDIDRGITRTLTSDDAGEYNAPNLTPGNYTVRAEAKGFKKLERQNVVLEVGKEVRVDLTVQPGAQEQTVTVTEAVPLVETTTATLGGTLENSEIADLPLNGRDYQNLLSLRPGVMLQPGGGPWVQATNGVRPDESVWMIDGVINGNFFDNRPIAGMPSPITDSATILPIDAIQEFNLMENPKAEYGWRPGATVNVGIKSGTNSLHGSAYGFYRSSAWDARNYFNVVPSGTTCAVGPLAACNKLPTQLKQFGGSVGGPIIKNKLFFFANYEGLRDDIGNAFGTTGGTGVPETGSSNGDTNNNMAAAIQALQATGLPRSPLSEKLAGCTEPTATTATCTGGFFPSNPSNSTGFLSTFPNVNTSDNGVAKIDYHINDKNTVSGDLIISKYLGDGEDRGFINPLFLNGYPISTLTLSGNWDYTPNSRMVNEVRIGYDRMSFQQTSNDAGITNPVNTGSTLPGLPTISVFPFGLLGTWHNRPQSTSPNPYWDVQDSISYLAGKHSLKFGGEFTHIEADSDIPDYGRGRINFRGSGLPAADFPCPPPSTSSCSSGLEDFFAGTVAPGNGKAGKFLVGNPNRRILWTSTAAFVQDDWRLAPKFTLNLGLRYSYDSPLREANNLWANFDPSSPTGLVQQGQGGVNTMWNADPRDFSPRVGFAWDVNGKGTTVVRGGFSVMYSTFSAVEWMGQNQLQNTSAVSLAANPTAANYTTCPASCLAGGPSVVVAGTGSIAVAPFGYSASSLCWDPAVSACPAGQATVFPQSASLSCGDGVTHTPTGTTTPVKDPAPCALMGVDPNLKTPYVMNFSFGITHAFTNNLSLEVGYVGDHGARLTGFTDINACAPNATGACNRPYAAQFPYFNYINMMSNDTRSNYNSLQTTLTKRMSHGVSFIAGYTYAHGLDNGSLNRFGLLPQNPNDPGAEYASGDFDVRHRLTVTGTYNIPGIKGFAQLLEGWQLNGIVTLQSAQPWVVNDYNNNFSGSGDFNDRWDFFGNPSDFKGTQTSIPYCSGFAVAAGGGVDPSGASCSQTSGVYGTSIVPAGSSNFIANCAAKAPSASTLAAGGCFASGNSVMAPPAAGTFGTMGRNIFRDSGFSDVDFSVFKNFTFKERYNAQFRLEVFNVLNHPIIENPYGASNGSSGGNNDPSSPSAFGAAIGTPDVVAGNPVIGSGGARDVQIGLKLTF